MPSLCDFSHTSHPPASHICVSAHLMAQLAQFKMPSSVARLMAWVRLLASSLA